MTLWLASGRVSPTPEWHSFGPAHLVALGIAGLVCFNVGYFRDEARRLRLDIWLAGSMLALYGAWICYSLTTGYDTLGDLLPLYTCDASIMLAVVWCVWKPQWLGQILFYWAFVGGIVSLLMPDTNGYTFPSFVAVHTVLAHILLLATALEVWLAEGVAPTWTSVFPVSVATLVLVAPSLAANAAFGSDYLFVSRNPSGFFGFLGRYDGVARVLLTLLSGGGLLLLALLVWFALDILNSRPRTLEDLRLRGCRQPVQ